MVPLPRRLGARRHMGSGSKSSPRRAACHRATTPTPKACNSSSGSSRKGSRRARGSPLNHPQWVLGGKEGGLLDLGNPAAWNWLVDHIDKLISSEGVDIYRQDFNMDPLGYWRANDPADRQGITEIKHVQGYLAYWDELRRRHPGMLIDSCASGGRRDDLETMRRAVPFLRSDYCTDPDGMQCHTYGFNLWLPYYRGAIEKIDTYDFRSNISPLMMVVWDMRNKGLDYARPAS